MQNTTPIFPGFHLPTLRRTPRSARQKLLDEKAKIKQKSFSELAEYFSHVVPVHHLKKMKSGLMSRQRIYSKENTFWAFFNQILDADGGCQEVVRKFQAVASIYAKTVPSSSTAAYCQARKNLDLSELEAVLSDMSKRRLGTSSKLQGRRVVVADGTGISMPDTPANQDVWPQPRTQKVGCGFPQARICACFDLASGLLNSYQMGNKKSHELPLLRKQWGEFDAGDIFLGDKMFCSYYDIARLADQGVDTVVTSRRKPVTAAGSDKVLGDDDLLIHWKKPIPSHSTIYTEAQGDLLPERLPLRQIKVTVQQKGFRVSSFYIVTTLLDPEQYPAEAIVDLYRQRWEVELNFRDIKTTMDMDVLRCKTPEMIRKEIVMHLIVYNAIRQLMLESAEFSKTEVRRVSFKASIQAIRQWEPHLIQLKGLNKWEMLHRLYRLVAQKIVFMRPDRRESRTIKRRPKNYQRMTQPRHLMQETPHRGKNLAGGA